MGRRPAARRLGGGGDGGGGSEIYALALPHADRIHLTEVDAAPEGDARFPAIPAVFREVAAEAHPAGPEDEHGFRFVTLARAP